MRRAPSILFLQQRLAAGLIGELRQIHAWGKQDKRVGGEDMMVLGTHLFDLIRFFAGDPLSCTARVLQAGRDLVASDRKTTHENIGPVAGDEIEAQFHLAKGVQATFTSRTALASVLGPWGLELVGTKGRVRLHAGAYPPLFFQKAGAWTEQSFNGVWERLHGDPSVTASAEEQTLIAANRRMVDDWLEAIRMQREPACSGHDGMKAVEMVHAVYQAALEARRLPLPLSRRQHPLAP